MGLHPEYYFVAAASSVRYDSARVCPEYLDNSTVAVVEGAIPETKALLDVPFDKILFTGSFRVASLVQQQLAHSNPLTPVIYELGGKSPCVVDEDADLGAAARRIIQGAFCNAGQTCVSPDYVLAHRNIQEALVAKMQKVIGEFFGPDPKQSRDFPRLINRAAFDRVSGYLACGRIVAGGETDEAELYIAPTLLVDVRPSDAVMQEEVFGPVLPILVVENVDEAIAFVNDQPKALAAYIYAGSSWTRQKFFRHTSSGGACGNESILQFLNHDLPFGGVGPSGTGHYHGRFGFEAFSHPKAVMDRPQWCCGLAEMDRLVRYPPRAEGSWVESALAWLF